jgi:branched-chain amino acid transport system permease protein
LVERFGLRYVRRHGQVAELLFTFGLSYVAVELVQLVWGKSALPYAIPAQLDGPLFTFYATAFPIYRGFMMLLAVLTLLAAGWLLKRSRLGLLIQAALTHPQMVEALGHNVPLIFTLVFAVGCGLAGLAGVVGGNAFVTEPGMAAAVGSIIFVVVVVGGLGSLGGAFIASLLIAILQTFAVALNVSLLGGLARLGIEVDASAAAYPLLQLTLAQVAPILPYLLLVLVMLLRPRGLLGVRD